LKTSVWDQLQITNQQLQIPSNFSAAHAAGKWFGYRQPRVARSEVRALSGAGPTIWSHWKLGEAVTKSQI